MDTLGYNAMDVADCLLYKYFPSGITHMKLQSLLYFSQCYTVKEYECLLFTDEMKMTDYGVICKQVYNKYHSFQENVILLNKNIETNFTNNVLFVLNKLYEEKGHYSSFDLEVLVCNDLPWIKAKINKYKQINIHDIYESYCLGDNVNNYI